MRCLCFNLIQRLLHFVELLFVDYGSDEKLYFLGYDQTLY